MFCIDEMRLDLFDGEGGADGAQGETNGAVPGSTRRGKSGEFTNVVFGKQEPQGTVTEPQAQSSDAGRDEKAGVQVTSDTLEERRKAFRDMVSGEYKDVYTEETQRMIDRRFKETKALQDAVNKNQPIIDMLMSRYKIEDGDTEKLAKALESDSSYWQSAADEAGMDVDQYREFERVKRENARLLREQRINVGEQQAQQQLQRWYAEAEAMKGRYRGFDLNAEAQNPQFLNLLKSGVPMEHAYKVIHLDSLMSDAMSTSAAEAEKKVAQSVRANGLRPQENGTASQSAFTVKDDVSKLTRRERAEIARRVQHGERISF